MVQREQLRCMDRPCSRAVIEHAFVSYTQGIQHQGQVALPEHRLTFPPAAHRFDVHADTVAERFLRHLLLIEDLGQPGEPWRGPKKVAGIVGERALSLVPRFRLLCHVLAQTARFPEMSRATSETSA